MGHYKTIELPNFREGFGPLSNYSINNLDENLIPKARRGYYDPWTLEEYRNALKRKADQFESLFFREYFSVNIPAKGKSAITKIGNILTVTISYDSELNEINPNTAPHIDSTGLGVRLWFSIHDTGVLDVPIKSISYGAELTNYDICLELTHMIRGILTAGDIRMAKLVYHEGMSHNSWLKTIKPPCIFTEDPYDDGMIKWEVTNPRKYNDLQFRADLILYQPKQESIVQIIQSNSIGIKSFLPLLLLIITTVLLVLIYNQ